MRTTKAPEVRRAEILDTAERLFYEKGYHQTSITDIMAEVGVAKGTLYYYFRSKEEVLDAIIERIVEADAAVAEAIVDDPGLSVFDKLLRVLSAQKPRDSGSKARMLRQIHRPANAELHQKTLVRSMTRMAPILTRIAEQGIREGVLHTEYPAETMQFLLAAGQTVLGEGLFPQTPADAQTTARAFLRLMERSLGAAPGSFDNLLGILSEKADNE